MKSVVGKMQRTPEQYAGGDPAKMAEMSKAAIMYALADAKHDVALLLRTIEEKDAVIERLLLALEPFKDATVPDSPSLLRVPHMSHFREARKVWEEMQ